MNAIEYGVEVRRRIVYVMYRLISIYNMASKIEFGEENIDIFLKMQVDIWHYSAAEKF